MTNSLALGFNPCLNNYAANALLSDYGDTFGSYLPMCGMPCFGMGNPMMGGIFGSGNYLEQMTMMQEYQINAQVRQQQLLEKAQVQLNGDNNVISQRIASLQRSVQANDQDNILTNYNALVAAVKQKSAALNGGVASTDPRSDAIARASAQNLYAQATGIPLCEEIVQYGDGTFAHGVKKALTFGLYSNERTAEENVATITGAPLEQGYKLKKGAGKALAGAAGVGAGVAIAVCAGPIGWVIGGIALAAVAAGSAITAFCKK